MLDIEKGSNKMLNFVDKWCNRDYDDARFILRELVKLKAELGVTPIHDVLDLLANLETKLITVPPRSLK